MKKFNIGDRVRAIGRVDLRDLTGKVGTVVCYGTRYDIGVEFDEKIGGHSCYIEGKNHEKKVIAGLAILMSLNLSRRAKKLSSQRMAAKRLQDFTKTARLFA